MHFSETSGGKDTGYALMMVDCNSREIYSVHSQEEALKLMGIRIWSWGAVVVSCGISLYLGATTILSGQLNAVSILFLVSSVISVKYINMYKSNRGLQAHIQKIGDFFRKK